MRRDSRALRLPAFAAVLAALIGLMAASCAAQSAVPKPADPLPDAPQPKTPDQAAKPPDQGTKRLAGPCPVKTPGAAEPDAGTVNDAPKPVRAETGTLTQSPCPPHENWYTRFTNGPQVKPLTPGEKGWLAVRNVVDPFNVITILADSGIAVGSDSHGPYGPGMPGFGRNAGVSFTQDMTGEFFNTFLIASIVHEDPHYHRMPRASIPRRMAHAVVQVYWTLGDNGRPMPNYDNLIGGVIDDEISNLYVPGRETNARATAERFGINLATAPIDNFVSEFLPDVASHIHVQVVVIQRIINQVAKTSPGDAP